ncbi:GntR family transcriptional regulator [Alicyclobacillus kakegawensis]|uniref:GntR family transcriptional regulator n=1 Tax=Alicyclobacillus kakegawensis TaxID=392012 RepID=UPI000829BF59|nr:GntR family transcriptional regulator [Alicyclobacillus kakegawensis]
MSTIPQTGLLTEEECYQRLRKAIVEGTLMPHQHLVEMDLVKSMNASRATVRTVLARLEQEGLVERERYRGARVRMVTQAEAAEILEVRAALEALIARHAAMRATDADVTVLKEILEDMRRCQERNDLISYSEGNARLHRKLVEIAGHQTAGRLLDTLSSQSVRYQYRTIMAEGRPENSLREHKEIVDAVAARNPDAAEEAMKIHLAHVCETVRQMKPGL